MSEYLSQLITGGDGLDGFCQRVDAFFAAHAPLAPTETGWGVGDDAVVAAGLAVPRVATAAEPPLPIARAFQAALFDAGLAWLGGPPEYGGTSADLEHTAAFRAIARRYAPPDTSVFMIGQRIVAPAILAHGSDQQRGRWLRAIWRGDEIGCQLFSEPDAGSDLASLRCTAVRDGDGWRINGQKVWSSGSQLADVGELLARTDRDLALRHRGLSMFLLDMHAPGVSVSPLRQMNGNAHFNEVYLDNVFLPANALLGALGGGWAVANASLSSERDLDHDTAGLFVRPVERLIELTQAVAASGEPTTRQALADVVARQRMASWHAARLRSDPSSRGPHDASMQKLYGSSSMWRLAQVAAAVLGPAIAADAERWGTYAWAGMVLGVHSQRIAGGTDEIQRNIIAERGLGLPREPQFAPSTTAGRPQARKGAPSS